MSAKRSGRIQFLHATLLVLILLTACQPKSSSANNSPWGQALRALDPADTSDPAADLTAVYLQKVGSNLQIRVDLLAFKAPKDLSLEIKIGDESAPAAEPLTIRVPSQNDSFQIAIDPQLATVMVTVPLSQLATRPRLDVSTPEDGIRGLMLDGPVPTQAAPLLLTFYDTLAGRFPAEALRSWDGAHSGPRGERHGLRYLLDAVEEYQTPIVLLDLKKPETLSALDAMGVLGRIRQMEEAGLLILPDISSNASSLEQQTASAFGFSVSPFLYNPYPDPWSNYDYRFTFTDDPAHIRHWFQFLANNLTYIPLTEADEANQPTPDGPSLAVRRALLETALNNDQKDLLVLGGSLADSTWGSPDMVGQTLAYFASRPYIKVLNREDLLNFSTRSGRPGLIQKQWDKTFSKMEDFYAIANGRTLDYAKHWSEHLPEQAQIRCDLDVDWDDQNECILADQHFLAVLDPQGARLSYFFTHDDTDLHQLIGPSWQVAVGLSDPFTWRPGLGEAADSGAYPGAFAEVGNPFLAYNPVIAGNSLIFNATDGTVTKTYTLSDSGIEVTYQAQEPLTTQIPMLVDPWTRFTPGWAQNYVQENTSDGFVWGLKNGLKVKIQFDGEMIVRAFNESLSLLGRAEDPNFEYPAGFYVPFPMAIAELKMNGSASTVHLILSP